MSTSPATDDPSRPQGRPQFARVAIVGVVATIGALMAGLIYNASLSDTDRTGVVATADGPPFEFEGRRGLDVPERETVPTTTTVAPTTTTRPPTTTTVRPPTTTTVSAPAPTAAPQTTAPPAASPPPPPPPTTAPPPPPTTTTTTAPPAPSGYTRNSSAEAQFVSLMNSERGGGFNHSSCIGSVVAAPWARHMADTDTLAHSSTYPSRISQCMSWSRAGENVGHGWSIESIHSAFMSSQTHRDNIMGDYNYVGVGVYQNASGEMWVAVNFAKA